MNDGLALAIYLGLHALGVLVGLGLGILTWRRYRPRVKPSAPVAQRSTPPRSPFPSLGTILADSKRALFDALREHPERVGVMPAEKILRSRARKNDRHSAWVKLSLPDEVVLSLGRKPEDRRHEVFVVTLPGAARKSA